MAATGERRILYVSDSLGMGGAERGLVLTLRHLDRERFHPEVAVLFPPETLAPDIEALGVRVHRLGVRRGLGALRAVPRLVQLLRRERFDAVHTQVVWASIAGRIAGRLARVKVISHIANVDPLGFEEVELPRHVARKARWVARLDELTGRLLVHRFVAISEAVRERPIRGRSWDKRRIAVVLRGQELERLQAEAAAEPEPPIDDPGEPCILAVGRLSPQKGTRFLLDAMPAVLEAFPNARLLLAGDGHLRAELEARARPLGDRVAFLGIRRDVRSLMARCDLFVFPSLWEGQGNALLEAMAVGAPIVATSIPSTLETIEVGEVGALVPPGDAGALADAMMRVLRDPETARAMGQRAREAARRYDIERTTRDLERVYDEVLGSGR